MEKKGVFYYIVYVLLVIWQLPQYTVSLIMWPFIGRKGKIAERHFNKCYSATKMYGGISLGPIAYVSRYFLDFPADIAHELDGHTVQSKILGPLYLFVIGIPSIIHAWLYNPKKKCYYGFYTEKWCNKLAKIHEDEKCQLKFDDPNDERNIRIA